MPDNANSNILNSGMTLISDGDWFVWLGSRSCGTISGLLGELLYLATNYFVVVILVHHNEIIMGMGCGGASLTPQVQFQVMPRTSSSGKGRQSLSVSRLTAVAEYNGTQYDEEFGSPLAFDISRLDCATKGKNYETQWDEVKIEYSKSDHLCYTLDCMLYCVLSYILYFVIYYTILYCTSSLLASCV